MDTNIIESMYNSLSYFIAQSGIFILKLIAAYVIWLVGKFIINLLVKVIKRVDIKSWSIDDKVRNTFIKIVQPTAKVVLVLVILDFLGIGTSIIGAFAQGLTFTIAIALGLAFGEALKPDAQTIVQKIKHETNVK